VTRRLLASVIATTLVCFGTLGLALGMGWSPHLGLDLEGGLSVVFKPAHPVSNSTLQNVANIMNLRVNALGVSQPNITTQGGDVVAQIPGAKNAQQILTTIGTTAQMYFRPVLCGAPAYSGPKIPANKPVSEWYKTPPTCDDQYNYLKSGSYDSSTQQYTPPPTDPQYADYPNTPANIDDTNGIARENVILDAPAGSFAPRYVLGPAVVNNQIVNGEIIKSAYAQLDPTTNQWVVVFNLTSKGNALFNDMAKMYYGQLVADDLDGTIVSAPIIESQTFPGSGQVSGNFDQQSATTLGQLLTYGALPVGLVSQTSQVVSPTLGKASLNAGLFAGLLGLALVMLYTIWYYRALGIVVVLGLVTTAAFLYGFISILSASSFGLTLDLSGVTGLIVSVGITVDSYIVYFERLKDEVRAGRTVRAAVDRGFRSAYRTILSADAVSFIGALVLWVLSVGAVRGFAFMLGLSTLVDVITAYTFTRPLVILLGRNRLFTESPHFGVARGLAVASS
jgi:preprotein translocase subunit SecD